MRHDDRPAAEGIAPGHFPGPAVAPGRVEPCPRRIRARTAEGWVVDTCAAFYVWTHPFYPQYAVPERDLPDWLRARALPGPADARLTGHATLRLDDDVQWYEEDEPVHGHPRSPYVRVDALRSRRRVVVVLPAGHGPDGGGRELARSTAPVAVFETGLPPRWYLDASSVDWSLLTRSETVTRCPYKGVASSFWHAGDLTDVAWSYPTPNPSVAAIAGLVAFDDRTVEVVVSP